MGEIGKVIEINGDKVTVQLERKEACAKCRACSVGMQSEEMLIDALNNCDAKLNDNVEIILEESNFYRAVLIMYGFPLLMLLLGVFSGYFVSSLLAYGKPEFVGVIAGVLLTVLSFVIIHLNEGRFRKQNYIPKAIKIHK